MFEQVAVWLVFVVAFLMLMVGLVLGFILAAIVAPPCKEKNFEDYRYVKFYAKMMTPGNIQEWLSDEMKRPSVKVGTA